jgi:hypothetical protein
VVSGKTGRKPPFQRGCQTKSDGGLKTNKEHHPKFHPPLADEIHPSDGGELRQQGTPPLILPIYNGQYLPLRWRGITTTTASQSAMRASEALPRRRNPQCGRARRSPLPISLNRIGNGFGV